VKTFVLFLLLLFFLSACVPALAPVQNKIAFVGLDGNLYTVQSNGDLLRPITADGLGYRHPTWSRNGDRLAFLNDDGAAILIASAGGEWFHPIYHSQTERPLHLNWAPDGRLLAFTTRAAGSAQLLNLISLHTESLQTVDAGQHLRWEWTQRGDLLVETNERRSRINVTGALVEESLIANSIVPVAPPAEGLQVTLLSPDGQSVACLFEGEDGIVLSFVNPWTGLERRRYIVNPPPQTLDLLNRLDGWHEGIRVWSPDSRYLVLAHSGDDGPAIWIYPATGNELPRRLVEGVEASWSWR
jgi:dipeptidyl aminopeptidase/acylaminoacyl peptidase